MFEVKDRKKYNAAVGKLFSVFGLVFILFGLPLLAGQNSPWIFLSQYNHVEWTEFTVV